MSENNERNATPDQDLISDPELNQNDEELNESDQELERGSGGEENTSVDPEEEISADEGEREVDERAKATSRAEEKTERQSVHLNEELINESDDRVSQHSSNNVEAQVYDDTINNDDSNVEALDRHQDPGIMDSLQQSSQDISDRGQITERQHKKESVSDTVLHVSVNISSAGQYQESNITELGAEDNVSSEQINCDESVADENRNDIREDPAATAEHENNDSEEPATANTAAAAVGAATAVVAAAADDDGQKENYKMPNKLNIKVQREDGQSESIVVQIVRPTYVKPFLGGYRHRQTGVEYHHAGSQTVPKPRSDRGVAVYSRDTQTAEVRTEEQQTSVVTSTQMTKPGVYVSLAGDRLMTPKRYVSAQQQEEFINSQAIVLQKYWRGWLAQKKLADLRKGEEERKLWREREEERKLNGERDRLRWELERRRNPQNRADFNLLYHALEQWRVSELERINGTLGGAERKAALSMMLDEEAQLIGTISRLHSEANAHNKNKIIQEFLSKTSESKRWRGSDGRMIEMDTPDTLRARYLRDVYNSLLLNNLTQDERLDVLLTVKETVKKHDCKLTKDIIELVDREADLLLRDVNDKNLDGLRKRIITLFLQYIKTPQFNPEASRALPDAARLKADIYLCSSCNRYLQSAEFNFSCNSSAVRRCRRCTDTTNDGMARYDYGVYRNMLLHIRLTEEQLETDTTTNESIPKDKSAKTSKISCLIQEGDVRFLVESIWGGRSALSASTDLHDLQLSRWVSDEEWSPWNCVLLTNSESKSHQTVTSLIQTYGSELIQRIEHRHSLARNYFSKIPSLSRYMRTRLLTSKPATELPPILPTRPAPRTQATC